MITRRPSRRRRGANRRSRRAARASRRRREVGFAADDVVEAAERGQAPTQYVYDAYGLDPRDFEDEYELRDALRDAELRRLPEQQEEITTAHAALSIADRAKLDTGGQTPAGLIRERYGLERDNYDDAEELRDAIDLAEPVRTDGGTEQVD